MIGLRNEISRNSHSLQVTRQFLVDLFETVELIIPGLWQRSPDLPSWERLYDVVAEEEILELVDRLHDRITSLLAERQEDDIVEHVSSFVRRKYHDPKLSYSYLSRSFKERTGVGLKEYLIRYRIDRFKELPESSEESISSIIQKIGYRGTYQFGRAFKKHEGLPPSEYRKLMSRQRTENVASNYHRNKRVSDPRRLPYTDHPPQYPRIERDGPGDFRRRGDASASLKT